MKSARLVAIVCASLAILLGLMMLPAPMPAAVKVTFIQTVLTTFLFIGAAIIFFTGGQRVSKTFAAGVSINLHIDAANGSRQHPLRGARHDRSI